MTSLTPRTMKNLPLAALLLAACSTGEAAIAVTTRDSAGVAIIEHPATMVATAAGWSLGAPTLTFTDAGDAEDTYTRISGASRLSDGRFLILDADNAAARPLVYAADGTFERRLGRAGQGPGEFQFVVRVDITLGDTILLYDFQAARLTRILPTGTVTGMGSFARFGMMGIGQPRGALADGRLVSTPFQMPDTSETHSGIFRQRSAVVVADTTKERLDTLSTELPGDEMYITTMSFGGQSASFPAPVGYGRSTIMLARGTEIFVADNDAPELRTYELPWRLTRVVRLPAPRTPVSAAARDAFVAGRVAEIERNTRAVGAMKEMMLTQARGVQFPDSMAYFSGALRGADGAIWLSEMKGAADSVPTYLVVGADGQLRARVTLPRASRLLWAGGDEVLVTLRDEDDLPRVELRPIVRP
jgi:hypothetical protein